MALGEKRYGGVEMYIFRVFDRGEGGGKAPSRQKSHRTQDG